MSAAQVPGVTDRRWEGVIATVRQDKGFGFIRCPELRKMYPEKDVFLHQRHLGSFREGDNVSFGVFMRDGKPQATDLAMVNGQQPMQQQQQQMAPQMGMQMGMPMGQGVPMQGMGMGMGMGMQMDMGMQQPSMGRWVSKPYLRHLRRRLQRKRRLMKWRSQKSSCRRWAREAGRLGMSRESRQ
ncbi:unnamed protein product [Effrenium voratum]|nr:unnamed protein product [Effrenium voratum]